jgi:hypothetical protein
MHQFLKFILYWNNTLHVSDGLSFHNQEFQDCTYNIRYVYVKQILILYVQS